MKTTLALFLLSCLICRGLAQAPATPPKKDPFAGFGNTSLDHRSDGKTPPSPFNKPPSAPVPAPAAPAGAGTTAVSSGIVLSNEWTGHLTQAAGGQTLKMQDLLALLSGFGTAESDTGPHPDVTVYEGPTMDPGANQTCRITYLMPLAKAEALLMRNRGISTATRAVAPGFPDGLFIHTYDIRAGIYNRLCLMTDSAKPDHQVVSLLLKAQGVNWYPPGPFVKQEGNWHTHDYMGTDNKGQPGQVIDTRLNDTRKQGHYLVINLTGGFQPEKILPPPGILLNPGRNSPKENSTWYLPEPLLKLILYSLSKQLGH